MSKGSVQVVGEFGWVEVGGIRYGHDIIIHSDGRVSRRQTELSLTYRSEYFHTPLSEAELSFIEEERPQRVIIGAGWKGMMCITPKANQLLEGYQVSTLLTERAICEVNRAEGRFVAILHMTC
jgi:hypothetical protein